MVTSVYVIEAGEKMVKIGLSIDPSYRLAQLQIGSPTRLQLAYSLALQDAYAPLVEREAHQRLARLRSHGEWFSMSSDAAAKIIVQVAQSIRPEDIISLAAPQSATLLSNSEDDIGMTVDPITGMQIRAARALLRWSAERLAAEAGIGVATVRRVDVSDGVPDVRVSTPGAIERAFVAGGLRFIPDGVRFHLARDDRMPQARQEI